MRIAQVSPLFEATPPKAYGGTERIVSYITEELVRRGHEVTLFASGDSLTTARLVPGCQHSLRQDAYRLNVQAMHTVQLRQVADRVTDFDVIHYHTDFPHFPQSALLDTPTLTTLHGRLDLPGLADVFSAYPDMPVVSISDAQRAPLPQAGWAGTVYHGLPLSSYRFQAKKGDYLAFLGRICPEKGVDRAIEIARRSGMPLKIAAKVDPYDVQYFETVIKPLLKEPGIEFIGEIGQKDKSQFLGGAAALLFPIDWPEPFGLVMIEAMACGTPVIAYEHGSVPEVLKDGHTAFLVGSIDEAVKAVGRLDELSRHACRLEFEDRFTVERMVDNYVQIYERLALEHASLIDAPLAKFRANGAVYPQQALL